MNDNKIQIFSSLRSHDISESPKNDRVTSSINCSLDKIGKLIGLQGCRIKEMRRKTGARIEVKKGPPCRVEIAGNMEQVSQAEAIVLDIIGGSNLLGSSSTEEDDEGSGVDAAAALLGGTPGDLSPSCVVTCTSASVGSSSGLSNQERRRLIVSDKSSSTTSSDTTMQFLSRQNSKEEGDTGDVDSAESPMELVIDCPNNKIATVIGKKGSVINQLTKQTGCRISIDQHLPESGCCKIKILGSQRQVLAAKELINNLIQGMNRGRPRQMTSSPSSVKDILIPHNLVPLLIGSGGATIHELQERSNTHIQVDGDSFTNAPRRVRISGTPESVGLAIDMLSKQLCLTDKQKLAMESSDMPDNSPSDFLCLQPLLSLSPDASPRIDGVSSSNLLHGDDDSNLEEELICPHAKIALVIGKRGAVVREIKRRSKCAIVIDNTVTDDSAGDAVQRMIFNGTREQIDYAISMVKAVMELGAVEALQMGTEILECPSNKASVVIGSGGSTIKEIMRRTGCRVIVSEANRDDSNRPIELTGTVPQIESARELINSVIEIGAKALL